MKLDQIKNNLPKTDNNILVVLSGGLDSSVATMILSGHYGPDRIIAISFDYGQKQKAELTCATKLCKSLGIKHKVLNLSILGEIARPLSANIIGSDISIPTGEEVSNDDQPKTYVPNRNMIMYSIAAAVAEVEGADYIVCGLQMTDAYGYWDTTSTWVDRVNQVLELNRKFNIKIVAPFVNLSKYDEIKIAEELGYLDLLKYTLTCYNPDPRGNSCGVCPSCCERIAGFSRAQIIDPIQYSTKIDWEQNFINYREKENN